MLRKSLGRLSELIVSEARDGPVKEQNINITGENTITDTVTQHNVTQKNNFQANFQQEKL
jgi:hypothetical protein